MIESTHTHLMNKEHKNFQEKEMRDLEREREKQIFCGNTQWVNLTVVGYIYYNKLEYFFGYRE